MLPKFKNFLVLLLGLAVAQQASAFSLLGPLESWQTAPLDYGIGDIGGSKNLGEEYRVNSPILVYGFDYSFLDYFGSNGVKAVDQAVAILNKLPTVSRASKDLSEFLTDNNQRVNQSAQALQLLDLKTATLQILLEHLGLMGEDHIFELHDRWVPGGAPSCFFNYTVIVRNFDPVTYEPSHYVNGILYTYQIEDDCPVLSRGYAVEVPVDPTTSGFTAAATTLGAQYGGYFLNITRDDMGGLRYMYRHDNYNNEFLTDNARATAVASSPWSPISIGTNGFSTNTLALRGGVEKVSFVKANYNSLLGTTFKTMTLKYTIPTVLNNQLKQQPVTRILTEPDIIFSAADISTHSAPPVYSVYSRTIPNYSQTSNTFGLTVAGPGVIPAKNIVTFNKIGPFFLNADTAFLDEITATKGYIWGSFDGSTNDPIAYPNGTSIHDLEIQVLSAPSSGPTDGTFNPAGF